MQNRLNIIGRFSISIFLHKQCRKAQYNVKYWRHTSILEFVQYNERPKSHGINSSSHRNQNVGSTAYYLHVYKLPICFFLFSGGKHKPNHLVYNDTW